MGVCSWMMANGLHLWISNDETNIVQVGSIRQIVVPARGGRDCARLCRLRNGFCSRRHRRTSGSQTYPSVLQRLPVPKSALALATIRCNCPPAQLYVPPPHHDVHGSVKVGLYLGAYCFQVWKAVAVWLQTNRGLRSHPLLI